MSYIHIVRHTYNLYIYRLFNIILFYIFIFTHFRFWTNSEASNVFQINFLSINTRKTNLLLWKINIVLHIMGINWKKKNDFCAIISFIRRICNTLYTFIRLLYVSTYILYIIPVVFRSFVFTGGFHIYFKEIFDLTIEYVYLLFIC